MATLKKHVSKGSQSWSPLFHTSNHNNLPLPFPPSSWEEKVGKRKLFLLLKPNTDHQVAPLWGRERQQQGHVGLSSKHRHSGPALRKLMAPLTQVGTGQSLPGGHCRRKQTEPQRARDYVVHQTTQKWWYWPCGTALQAPGGQHCQTTLWLTLAVGKEFLNKNLG